jgi:DNA transposition AAA+ family ATPase
MDGFMSFVVHPKEGEEPGDEALIGKLKRFVEESDLSLYQIATLIGTSGVILSMWLAGTAKPHTTELNEIDRFLRRGEKFAERSGFTTEPRGSDRGAQ